MTAFHFQNPIQLTRPTENLFSIGHCVYKLFQCLLRDCIKTPRQMFKPIRQAEETLTMCNPRRNLSIKTWNTGNTTSHRKINLYYVRMVLELLYWMLCYVEGIILSGNCRQSLPVFSREFVKPTRTSRCNEQVSYKRCAFAKPKKMVPAHSLKVASKVLIFIEILWRRRADGPR